jgi:hypothetical protein
MLVTAFLAAVYEWRSNFGLAVTDITTGNSVLPNWPMSNSCLTRLVALSRASCCSPNALLALREQLQNTFPAVHLTLLADSFSPRWRRQTRQTTGCGAPNCKRDPGRLGGDRLSRK